MSKRTSQLAHAKRRYAERTGQKATRADLHALATNIRSGHSTVIERQSNRISVHRVQHVDVRGQHTTLDVVYDRKRNVVVTILPPTTKATVNERRRYRHQLNVARQAANVRSLESSSTIQPTL